MHRQQLLALLEKYIPATAIEHTAKLDITQFIHANRQCFARTLTIGHITASAWLVSKDLQHVLLMHHAKLDMWCQLGGHCDGESDVLNAAIREAQEESGINAIVPVIDNIFDLDVHPIPATTKEPAHYHYDVRFLLRVNSDEQPIQNSESKDLRWFSGEESLLPTNAESILRMFRKWRALVRARDYEIC